MAVCIVATGWLCTIHARKMQQSNGVPMLQFIGNRSYATVPCQTHSEMYTAGSSCRMVSTDPPAQLWLSIHPAHTSDADCRHTHALPCLHRPALFENNPVQITRTTFRDAHNSKK